ncbi:hypothetical protein PAXRUDRAFT_824480 [Paxillus rubicundulus Ve08.2h10]|uniref:Uncharacterized protein n=1 Tax=Paxillus rubicundulus Ve08.2h10 TaxID=930991 RepID=A0A0D0DHY3_9AGAM|nr:hypothetical protein PAXRUDRAFT_824480 [Paxillus rubicundulus Ve08.2h10]
MTSQSTNLVQLKLQCLGEGGGFLKITFYEMARRSRYGLGYGDDEGGMDVDEESEGGWDNQGSIAREDISGSDGRPIGRMREHLVLAWAQDAACLDPLFTCPHWHRARDGSHLKLARLNLHPTLWLLHPWHRPLLPL